MMSVRYVRLAEEKRTSRRTIADVLDVLREDAGFGDSDQANIIISPLQLPSGQVVGLVQIACRPLKQEVAYIVSLPTSCYFHAARQGSSKREKFAISGLNGATVNASGRVCLANGLQLRAVEVFPVRLPYEPSELDWRILRHMIEMIGAEQICYRHLGEGLPPRFREMVPDLYGIDCRRLSELKCPLLKIVAGYIADNDHTIDVPSHQKIADALCIFGVRVPRARPRRASSPMP